MMDAKYTARGIFFIVLACAIIIMLYDNEMKRRRDISNALQEIKAVRKTIVTLDSVSRARDYALRDSIKKDIAAGMTKADALHTVNENLRKQNEKLDRLYRSIDLKLPDL